jgi:ribosome-binding protein aMBF1 (putative translation factor)
MTTISELHRRWSKDRDYKEAYDALVEEFDLARALIEARTAAGLSQSQLAKKMKTSQSARLTRPGATHQPPGTSAPGGSNS